MASSPGGDCNRSSTESAPFPPATSKTPRPRASVAAPNCWRSHALKIRARRALAFFPPSPPPWQPSPPTAERSPLPLHSNVSSPIPPPPILNPPLSLYSDWARRSRSWRSARPARIRSALSRSSALSKECLNRHASPALHAVVRSHIRHTPASVPPPPPLHPLSPPSLPLRPCRPPRSPLSRPPFSPPVSPPSLSPSLSPPPSPSPSPPPVRPLSPLLPPLPPPPPPPPPPLFLSSLSSCSPPADGDDGAHRHCWTAAGRQRPSASIVGGRAATRRHRRT